MKEGGACGLTKTDFDYKVFSLTEEPKILYPYLFCNKICYFHHFYIAIVQLLFAGAFG